MHAHLKWSSKMQWQCPRLAARTLLHLRRTRPRSLAAATSQKALTPVLELLVFLEARRDAPAEDKQAMVEQLWSQQYAAPGVITACGGPLFYPAQPRSSSPGPHEAEPAQAGSGATSTSGFTHMVHFRFSNTAQAKAFLRQPLVKSMLTVAIGPQNTALPLDDRVEDESGQPICVRTAVLTFQGAVESDVMSLFRRGPDFEQGYELMVLLRDTQPSSDTTVTNSQPTVSQLEATASRPTATATTTASQSTAAAAPADSQPASQPATASASTGTMDSSSTGAETPNTSLSDSESVSVSEYLTQLSLLAQSSLAGAVQVSQGPVMHAVAPISPPQDLSEAVHGLTHIQDVTDLATVLLQGSSHTQGFAGADNIAVHSPYRVFMARFLTQEQLDAFRSAGPYVRLWAHGRDREGGVGTGVPLRAEAEIVMQVGAVEL